MNDKLPVFWHAGYYNSDHNVPHHQHAGAEIIYMNRGFCTSELDKHSLDSKQGELVVVAPGTVHSQKNHEYTETLFAVFSANQGSFDCSSRVISIDGDEMIVAWLNQLIKLNDAMLLEQCRGLMFAILSRISMLENKLNSESTIMPQLNRALKYIEDIYARPVLSQEEIAKKAGISVSYLKKLFQRQFETSPMKYVQKERMLIARQLLRNQYLFINEVGEKCGYPDPNYFSRIFRKIHRMTPGEFRHSVNDEHHDIKWNKS